MRLWVDDLRPPPDTTWAFALNSRDAIAVLDLAREFGVKILEMSLDHDLGGKDTTRRIVMWMAQQQFWPEIMRVHTSNPPGREWLEGMIERYGPGVTR